MFTQIIDLKKKKITSTSGKEFVYTLQCSDFSKNITHVIQSGHELVMATSDDKKIWTLTLGECKLLVTDSIETSTEIADFVEMIEERLLCLLRGITTEVSGTFLAKDVAKVTSCVSNDLKNVCFDSYMGTKYNDGVVDVFYVADTEKEARKWIELNKFTGLVYPSDYNNKMICYCKYCSYPLEILPSYDRVKCSECSEITFICSKCGDSFLPEPGGFLLCEKCYPDDVPHSAYGMIDVGEPIREKLHDGYFGDMGELLASSDCD